MSAPALLVLAPGSYDANTFAVCANLVSLLRRIRSKMLVAASNHSEILGSGVIDELIQAGADELVIVPLNLTKAINPGSEVDALLLEVRQAYPQLPIITSRPIGPESSLLNILDAKLRDALSAGRVLELDGLVLLSADCGDVRGASLLARRARQWAAHHRVPCVTATADNSGTSLVQAISSLRAQGRRHIAVGSLFLTSDMVYQQQVKIAFRAGAIAVSDPIGADLEIAELILARYAFAAMDLLDFISAETTNMNLDIQIA